MNCKVKDCKNIATWGVKIGCSTHGSFDTDTNLCNHHMKENETKNLVLDNGAILESKESWKRVI